MIEIIKRHEGYKSENMQLDGQRAQISYNSDGHLCIRLLQADPEQDTLVVLGATTSHEVIRFLLRARDNDIPCPFCGRIPQITAKKCLSSLKWNKNYPNNGRNLYIEKEWYSVECICCELLKSFTTEEEAIAAWNRRAAGWIPTVERLPEENVDCLVYPASEEIVIARLVKGNFYYWWFDAFDSPDWVKVEGVVTHWMPLPKPPELCEGGGIDVTIR